MRVTLSAIAAIGLMACTSITNPGAAPGESVSVNSEYFLPSLLLDFDQPGRSSQRVLIIAPEDARRCSAEVFGAGPLRRGVPDAERRILLDFPERESVRVRCETARGAVERQFGQVVVHRVTAGPNDRYESIVDYYPPMIHVGEIDAQAPARGTRLRGELCEGGRDSADLSMICREESFAELRRADIGE